MCTRPAAQSEHLRLPGPDDDLAGPRFHAPPELPDVGANHVRIDQRIGSDPQEADPGLAAAVRRSVGLKDSAAHPEASEDIGPLLIGPVQGLGSAVQLDGRRGEEPQEPPHQRDDQRDGRVRRDIPRLLEVPPGHHIDRQVAPGP